MSWPVRTIRLASRPQEAGLRCGYEGITLAGHSLLKGTNRDFVPRPLPELQAILNEAYGEEAGLDAATYLHGLASAARSLNKGDLPLAMISSVMLKLPENPGFPTRKYFDEQPRDENGRWTQGAEGEAKLPAPIEIEPNASPTLAPAEEAATGVAEEETIAGLAPQVIGLLGELASALAFPVAVAAGILIPTNRSNIHYGDLPDFPGLSYRSDEGMVTINRLDASGKIQTLYSGAPDAGDFYRDTDGHIIGRHVGTGVLFDIDALDALNRAKAQTAEGTSPNPDFAALAGEDNPKICPPPSIEDITGRSARMIAYQAQITGLLPGFDVEYQGIRFDGCDENTGRMQEAKGLGMEWMLRWPRKDLIKSDFYIDMMDQAKKQNNAAASRGDDYYFASKEMADFFGSEFEKAGYKNIIVHHVEAIVKKFEDCIRWIPIHLHGRADQSMAAHLQSIGGLGNEL